MEAALNKARVQVINISRSLRLIEEKYPELLSRLKEAELLATENMQPSSTSAAGTSAGDFKKSTLYIMKLAGMTKEKNRLEESLRVMKENIATRYAKSRANIEASLSSKRHVNTCMAKMYHGVCDNGIERWRSKFLGRSSYGIRSDLRNIAPRNRILPSESSSVSGLAAGVDEQYSKLWTSSGHLLHPAYTAVIDRSGRFAISGSDDYLVKIWDIETGQLVCTCRGHKGPIVNIVLSADNSLMATACMVGTVRLWRLVDGRCLKIWRHTSQINCLTFDSLTCALIYGGEDGDCMVWDLTSLLHEDEDDDLDDVDNLSGLEPRTAASGRQAEDAIDVDQTDSSEAGMCSQRKQGRLKFTGQYPLLECAIQDMNDRIRCRLKLASSADRGGPSHVAQEVSISACALSNLVSTREGAASSVAPVIQTSLPAPDVGMTARSPSNLTLHQEELLRMNSELFSWNEAKYCDNFSMFNHHSVASMSLRLPPVRSLCLPHVNADLKGDKIAVESMDMCSVNCLLVTGGSDGVARVWRLNEPTAALDHQLAKLDPETDWSAVPTEEGLLTARRHEKVKQDLEILRALNPAVCEQDKIEKLETVAYRQLCRLEGHTSAVTDVQFSHAGDRILTGSWKKDGTVRIWNFSKDFLKHEHLILSINENDSVNGEVVHSSRGGRGRNRSGNKPQIHNVYWSCDDSTVLVVHSFVPNNDVMNEYSEYCNTKREGTRLRVYNSSTGQLLKMITISLQKCHVLACHPSNPHLAFTAGKEGVMSVWNVRSGERVSQHHNQCPEGGLVIDNSLVREGSPLEIVDGKFSPDGLRIAATDVIGRVIILGNDNPKRFQDVNDTQYFLSDYSTVIHDRQGWPIDADSQLPLHRAPVGPLCRTDCTPYANQPASFPLPRPLEKEVVAENLKELLFWRDKYSSTVSRTYSNHKKLMMRMGDNSSFSVSHATTYDTSSKLPVGSFSRVNTISQIRRRTDSHVDNYSRRFKRSRYESRNGRPSYREDSEDEGGNQNGSGVESEEAEEEESDSEEEEEEYYEEEYSKPRTRGESKPKPKTKTDNNERSRTRRSNDMPSGRPKSGYSAPAKRVLVEGLIADCSGCGIMGKFCRSISHRITDEITRQVTICGKFTENPRELLPDSAREGNLANCSGCDLLGPYQNFTPPSGTAYFKPHIMRSVVDNSLCTQKCGEFVKNPRKGSELSDAEWQRAKHGMPVIVNADVSTLCSSSSSSTMLPGSSSSSSVTTTVNSVDGSAAIKLETTPSSQNDVSATDVGTDLEKDNFEEIVGKMYEGREVEDDDDDECDGKDDSSEDDGEDDSSEANASSEKSRLVYPPRQYRDSNDDSSDDEKGYNRPNHQATKSHKRKAVPKSVKKTVKEKVIAPWAQHNGHRTVPLTATIDSAWLRAEESIEQQYLPQVGDKVIYFPQGHMEHLQVMPENSSPPWFTYHSQLRHLLNSTGLGGTGKWPFVECKVVDYWYDFPKSGEYKKCNSALVEIELEITGVPSGSISNVSSSHNAAFIYPKFQAVEASNEDTISFTVTLRNLNLPDFLVPSYLYFQAALVPWKRGTKFQTYFKEDVGESNDSNDVQPWKSYPGVLLRCTQFEEEWQGSPWNSLEIIWAESLSRIIDENRIERISPWDARIRDDANFTALCAKNPSCLPPKLPRRVITSLVAKIQEIMTMEEFEPFSYPIDSNAFADYYCIIPCTMYLDLIKERLESNFYRQLGALERDIAQILRNCEQYNQEGSPIITDAQKLVTLLDGVIKSAADSIDDNDNDDGNELVMGSSGLEISTPRVAHSSSSSTEGPGSSSEQMRMRFRNNAALQRSPVSNNDDNSMPPPSLVGSTERSPVRRSRRSRQALVDEEEEVKYSSSRLASKRKRNTLSRSKDQESSDVTRSSGRTRGRQASTRYTEVDCDVDDDDISERESSCDEEQDTMKKSDRRSESRTATNANAPPRKSSRRGAATRYVESGPDDNDDDDDDDSDDDGDDSNDGDDGDDDDIDVDVISSTRGGSSSTRHTQSKELAQSMNDIVDFCEGLDEDYGFFMYPVDDSIAPGYSEIISKPMDYSLIR